MAIPVKGGEEELGRRSKEEGEVAYDSGTDEAVWQDGWADWAILVKGGEEGEITRRERCQMSV